MASENSYYKFAPHAYDVEKIKDAIERSGYPLQASVSRLLEDSLGGKNLHHWNIQEEWSYFDPEIGSARSVDALADIILGDVSTPSGTIQQHLSIVLECKQSESPYVFFLRERDPVGSARFPIVVGLKQHPIPFYLHNNGLREPVGLSFHDLLDLHDVPFFSGIVHPAVTLSKAKWKKGSELELTGEDAYRSLTLPLIKASNQLSEHLSTDMSSRNFIIRYVVCVAVLRSPMAGVIPTEEGEHIRPTPVARVFHLEPPNSNNPTPFSGNDVRHYDAVHEEFLGEYLDKLFEAFRVTFSRVERVAEVLLDGYGCANLSKADDEGMRNSVHLAHHQQRDHGFPDISSSYVIGRYFR